MYMLPENDRDTAIHARAKKRGQRTFTLVEQDNSAVDCIAYWILKNIHTAPSEKLHDALETCILMRDFKDKKNAD